MNNVASKLILPALMFVAFLAVFAFGDNAMRELSSQALGRTFAAIPYVLSIGAWLSAAFFLNRIVDVFVWEILFVRLTGAPTPRLLMQISGTLIFFAALLGIVGIVFNQPLTGILTASGAMGLVIGLALQTMIRDVFSGVALNVERPFRMGDYIAITDRGAVQCSGRVEEINWRSTRLLTEAGSIQVVPNSVVGASIITNFSRPVPVSEFEIPVVLDFAVESERALSILSAALTEAVLSGGPLAEPAPKAQISAVDPAGVRYKLKYSIDPRRGSPGKMRHLVLEHVLHHLMKAGLTPAVPKTDMFQAPMPPRTLDYYAHGAQLLARVSLFRGFTEGERKSLSEVMQLRRFKPDEVLMRSGDTGSSMFILVEGLLEVGRPKLDGIGLDKLGRIRPGEFFGEMALLTGLPRSATITALANVVAFEIKKEHMTPILESRPTVAQAISEVVAERQVAATNPAANDSHPREAEVRTVADRILGGIMHFFGLSGGLARESAAS